MKYKIEKNGKAVTITDVSTGIGLCFTEGESLQRYTASLVVPEISIMETEDGVRRVGEISRELEEYAAGIYPREFAEIK
ncbi:hypothetical protein [Bacteroides acidifaciens]|mgnify:FL=1|uniref:hypothetical protein n=1 Tax=Bacteroides acidifaciens TaxID=85831 RepID=UPI00258FACFB|nr:hypothetical protein [Bacteroides acidifaciens]